MQEINSLKIEKMIYVIRGQKVMLDSDLAKLYGVVTKNLNKAVKRNIDRFPDDFMFQLNEQESECLRFQFGTSKKGGRRYLPFVFSEGGVAMLSSVLNSERASKVNISIIRTFIRLRSFLAMDNSLSEKVDKLEQSTNKLFRIVFQRLDLVEENAPKLKPNRKKIGLN
ncbi:MAG: ORF6N domain-containing protein [Bacteriovoracaceae bacterium]|nr:ORF6N domain-containing protein [Bacteriovoracaceae bacterium]